MPNQMRRRLLAGAAILCALACAAPARALAARTLETSLMDDRQLIYSPPSTVQQTMEQIKALGIDRVKVSMVWTLVAPQANSARRPSFDATDPNAYPQGVWDRYDLIVNLAQQLGLGVYFQFDPPVPKWAIPPGEPAQSQVLGRAPQMSGFEQFVEAVGRRYSGTFTPAVPPPPNPGLLGGLVGSNGSTPSQPSAPLPRVSYWSVWNEPNIVDWLNPYHSGSQLLQPSLYRGLLNAAWRGLQATGHTPATDTILIAEMANSGLLRPIPFARALYCVDASYRSLTGSAAANLGCPTSGSRASFVQANPALFYSTGIAHHPYSFDGPPDRPYNIKGWVTMYNLSSLETTLNGIFSSYGLLPYGGVPLYLTEFGYESNPPNPYVHNTTGQQAKWLNEAEYMAWRYPYVHAMSQFELLDSPPNTSQKAGSYAYWASEFETGLEFDNGQPKPAFAAFMIPIWLPKPRHGRSVQIWGQVRPTSRAQSQYAVVQYLRRGAHAFKQLRAASVTSPEGFLFTHAAIPAPGVVRLAWLDPGTGSVDYSRSVSVR